MTPRRFDSTKTRVTPVFDALLTQPLGWVTRLLDLAAGFGDRPHLGAIRTWPSSIMDGERMSGRCCRRSRCSSGLCATLRFPKVRLLPAISTR
jgi:hypothetical protein